MTIGIIGAMDIEIEKYLADMKNYKTITKFGLDFFAGTFEEKKVVVVKSGIGKVNSAMCAQILIQKFNVSKIIFTGVAGALNPELDIHGLVISNDTMQHDFDVTALGYEIGEIPEPKLKIFKADDELKQIALDSAKEVGLNAIEGRILSGDQFIADKSKSKFLREELKGDCVEMEGASVGQVCHLNEAPHIIIRAMSDKADEEAELNYPEFAKVAAENSYRLVKTMIPKINDDSNDKLEIIKDAIQTIPDFPKPGIQFRDITSLIQNPKAFNILIEELTKQYIDQDIDVVVGIESRGFITGAALANKLDCGLVLIRKKGKLPGKTISEEYELEYGTDVVEMHENALNAGQKVLIVDDLIATGGTALAAAKLVEKANAKVQGFSFIVDLPDIGGSKKLGEAGYVVNSLIEFEGD